MKYTIRSVEEKRALVDAWRASDLSWTRFANAHGMSPTSLGPWSSAPRPSLVVEVAGSGHRVVVPAGFDAGELRRLVAALC